MPLLKRYHSEIQHEKRSRDFSSVKSEHQLWGGMEHPWNIWDMTVNRSVIYSGVRFYEVK